jgi:hypothetical protein
MEARAIGDRDVSFFANPDIGRENKNWWRKDMRRFPIGEFASDEEGQDEATVRPFDVSGALDRSDGMFVVRARFTLADGTQMLGYPPTR